MKRVLVNNVASIAAVSRAIIRPQKGYWRVSPDGSRRREVSSIVLKLTPRQRQVVELLLDAADNKFIAKKLGITENAVKILFNRIYKANGITCGDKRVKLAAMAYREKRKVNGT